MTDIDGHLRNFYTKYLYDAAEFCNKSTMNSRHGAILLNVNSIVGSSYNSFPNGHAETNALNRYSMKRTDNKVRKLKNLCVVVVRTKRNGHFGNSRPCNMCIDMMIKMGIKRVVYSTGDERIFAVENPRKMERKHISSGNLYKFYDPIMGSKRYNGDNIPKTSSRTKDQPLQTEHWIPHL
jgi:pyrimidine deaminase RibD-like protein